MRAWKREAAEMEELKRTWKQKTKAGKSSEEELRRMLHALWPGLAGKKEVRRVLHALWPEQTG